jgi:hypothetical protein
MKEHMDRQNDEMLNERSIWSQMGFLEWLALILPTIILVLGLGIIAGVFFVKEPAVIHESVRWFAGLAFCLWGAFRITMLFIRLNRQRRGGQNG